MKNCFGCLFFVCLSLSRFFQPCGYVTIIWERLQFFPLFLTLIKTHEAEHLAVGLSRSFFWRLGSVVTRDRTPTFSTRGGHMWPIYMYTEFWNDIIKKCVHSITGSCILVYWARQDRIYCNDLTFCNVRINLVERRGERGGCKNSE